MKKFSLLLALGLLMFSCADQEKIQSESFDSVQPTVIPDQIPELPPNFQKVAVAAPEDRHRSQYALFVPGKERPGMVEDGTQASLAFG